jgi:GntR family transcriptional regulator, rspAB operon transcriptional repressor
MDGKRTVNRMNVLPLASPSKNLDERAYEALRDRIITLELKPGQTIQENELAVSLRISRTPIRDAFRLLIAERLVEVLPQRTRKVALISASKVKETAFVRLCLEGPAFREAARRWERTERHLAAERRIAALLQEQREAAERQDVAEFLRLDEAFHRCVLQMAGNGTLLEVVYHMRGHLNRFRYLAMKELKLTAHLTEEHRELFDCLRRRDEAGAAQLLERHLGNLDEEIPLLRERFPDYFQD